LSTSNNHVQQAADRFDNWSNTYGEDRISGWFQHYQQTALDRFQFTGAEQFLDVGCGTGWAVRCVAQSLSNGHAYGIDISPAMINKAKSLSESIENCTFSVADSESIPYPDDFFDTVLCTFSFHHYETPLNVLSEFRRVLKDNGSLIIVDSARNLSWAIWLQDRGRRYLERSHVKYYTVNELQNLLKQSDFYLKQDIYTDSGVFKFGKVFTGLMMFVAGKRLRDSIGEVLR
jgi:ubiquinone/menaquinone biosynthesis C-methylase UbiE